jgi:hypothetical protein
VIVKVRVLEFRETSVDNVNSDFEASSLCSWDAGLSYRTC